MKYLFLVVNELRDFLGFSLELLGEIFDETSLVLRRYGYKLLSPQTKAIEDAKSLEELRKAMEDLDD